MGIIDALEVDVTVVKSMAEGVEIVLNDMPTPLKKKAIKAIRAWGAISGKRFDDIIDLV
jgi:molecular chaperone GrpE (heat shock protein)